MHKLCALVVLGSITLAGCDDGSEAGRDTAHASAAEAGGNEGPSGDAGQDVPRSQDASSRDAPDGGRAPGLADGGASALVDAGEPGAGATPSADAGPLPSLRIYSDTATIEFTPALFTAQRLYPGSASVQTGGIANLFNRGQADLATNAETQTLRQSVQHPELRIVLTVTETFYRIVARRSSGIVQLTDLAGKRVGTIQNTSAHYYLDKMLRTVGLNAGDVSVVSVFPLSRMPPMLESGQLDAVTAWEPEPQNAADAIGADAIEFQDRAVYREIVNLHTTSAQLADPDKRRAIVAFVKALRVAAEQFQNSPEQAWPFVSEAIGYPPELLAKVWHLERFPGTLAPDLLDVLEEEERWVAEQSGRPARTRAELAPLIDDSVLQEALAP